MPITPFNDLRNPYSVGQTYLKADGSTVTTGTGYAVIVRLLSTYMHKWKYKDPGNQSLGFERVEVPINEFNVEGTGGSPNTAELGGSGISVYDWGYAGSVFQAAGHPSHASYTAFFSFDDYTNSDFSQIAPNPATWQKGELITYKFGDTDQTWDPIANGAIYPEIVFVWEVIEVVDEAMYNGGAGVPIDGTITQATYGEIPVGTITAAPGDPVCNGCTDFYDNLGVKNRQNKQMNQTPGYFLESNGPQLVNNTNVTNIKMDPYHQYFSWYLLYADSHVMSWDQDWGDILWLNRGLSLGFYFGQLFTFEKADCKACRDPLALNYDQSTSPIWDNGGYNVVADPTNQWNTTGQQLAGIVVNGGAGSPYNPQRDCADNPFKLDQVAPINSSGVPGELGDLDCCLYSMDFGSGSGSGSGSGCPDDVRCGCMDTNAANFCNTCTDDCSGVFGGSDTSCCEYYHLWEICGAHGGYVSAYNNLAGTLGNYPNYYNLTGNFNNSWNSALPNNPASNDQFMNYVGAIQGAPSSIQIGDIIHMRSMGMPGNWFCLEYHGPKPYSAQHYDNLAGGSATAASVNWTSNAWWGSPPATDGNGDLIVDSDCFTCTNPQQANPTYLQYEICSGPHTGEVINIINDWATDPIDHFMNNNPGNPNLWWFQNEIGLVLPSFSCTLCQNNTQWLVTGMILSIKWDGQEICAEYIGGSSSPQGNDVGGWVPGIGAGTDNFITVDPQDPLQLIDVFDTCPECSTTTVDPCIPICSDPNSAGYVVPPWPVNACDCNGDPIGTQNPGWNSCCNEDPCDGVCNDPLANNYDPSGAGCCGSGPGIGTAIDRNIGGNCSDTDTIVGQHSTASFHQYLSTQANGLTATGVDTIQYENMDSIWFGQPTPPGACVGPNGGYMASFALGDGYIPHSSIQADINPGAPGTIYSDWDTLIAQCITVGVTGVTQQTTFDELNILLTAWNPNGAGIPVEIIPPTNIFCQCIYASYAQNNDCCTYNWRCSSEIPQFAMLWPTQDSNSVQANVKTQYNNKFGLNITDINPRPESTFTHINDTGYIFPGLAYLNTPLRFSNFRNLGLHFNSDDGSQGWKGGKQPKLTYVNKYPEEWSYAYSFMQAITDGTITNGNTIDLTQAYYKVKTNMISLEGNFLNKKAKVITTPIPGGTTATGLYYHIIPAGAITIPKEFQSVFPTVAGKKFNTWKSFINELLNYDLPASATTWEAVSEWVIAQVEAAPGFADTSHKSAPEFIEATMQWMVQGTDGCLCYEDPNGPFDDQVECQTNLIDPSSGDDNCCACVYGCTDPSSSNYDPLATCDDGSCINCDPFIIRFCSDMANGIEMYHRAYLGNPGDPQTCANSQALIQAWGLQNFWDIVGVNYTFDGISYTYCVQWVDPSVQYYQTWLANNPPSPTAQFFPTQATAGGNFVYTPNNPNVNSDSQCQFCFGVGGCTDQLALNYNQNCAGATVVPTFDDGCCQYCVYGCMDTTAGGFPDINGHGSNAVYDCDVSTTIPTVADACTYPCATGYLHSNFNPCATCDDGTCEQPTFHKWSACEGSPAGEFAIVAPGATWNDILAQDWFYNNVGSPCVGCTINTVAGQVRTCYEYKGTSETSPATVLTPLPQMSAWEYDEMWNGACSDCICIYGCTDDSYCNYDPLATCDDGTCCNDTGCMDEQAFNYCPTCCCDGPCTPVIEGCMDTNANNYDPTANTPCSECCDYTVYGCTDINAINFDPTATINQTSATDPTDPCKYLDQCKRAPREFGSDPTKKLNVECEFASDVYKEYRKQRYGLSNYCGSDLPDHLHEKQLCDWEDTKRPAYLSSTLEVLATYEYPIVDGEPDWMDPARPAWTNDNCGLTSDVDIDIYFMYDCTSMGLAAIQQQRNAADDWIDGFTTPFAGEVYHVLVCGERWIDWATTIFTGAWNNAGTCGGKDSYCVVNGVAADYGACLNIGRSDAVAPTDMSLVIGQPAAKFWLPMQWGNANNKPWYSSAPLGWNNGSITHLGYPPALTKREVLGVFFADESGNGTGTGADAQPYHVMGCNPNGCTTTWPQATDGTGSDHTDSKVTACFKADYDKYIEKYKEHLAKGPLHKATMVIYPSKPLGTIHVAHRAFPLHALAAVDSGNNTPKDGRYAAGTAPNNSLANLSNIEVGNPYWDTTNPNQPASHTYGYGGLDNYGWNANVAEGTFDVDLFKADLESYWDPNKLKCDGSECIVVNVVNQNNVAIPDYDIYVDGGFVGKTDEFGRLKFQIENAAVKTNHIINLCLCIETKGNCRQQQIKITVTEECPPECCVDPTGVSCETYVAPTQVFEGCTDPNASNYNPMATVDDGSCLYCDPGVSISETHVDASAFGVNDGSITAVASNGTIPYTYSWTGPSGYTASTAAITGLAGGVYTLTVTDAENCTNTIIVNLNQPPLIFGCMDNTTGLWPNINGLDQNGAVCTYPCTSDGTLTGTPEGYKYFCYNPDATDADECCEAGCTDQNAVAGPQGYCPTCQYDCNMEPIGTNNAGWDSCCELCELGCMDPIAANYDAGANCDDGSCVYYWECDEAGWDLNEIYMYNYQLSAFNNGSINGVYIDTSCQAGFCDLPWFYGTLADYYSDSGNEGLLPGQEVTAVGDGSGGNYMNWGMNPCPLSVLDSYYSGGSVMPLLTIGGYTTENPIGPTGSNSCYAQLQINDFGAGYVFPSWQAYMDWHNGTGGPNQTCSGSQIPVINAGQNWSYANNMHDAINSGTPDQPDPEDNWVYYTIVEPACSGYSECECNQVFTVEDNDGFPGTHPTKQDCEDAINCCGSGSGSGIGGCIDNGYVDQHPDFGTYGAVTVDNWWINAANAAGISYSQQVSCDNGIVAHELVANGGSGQSGTGVPQNYQYGVPALNYNPLATYDDGSCCYCSGCMDDTDMNYEPQACFDNPDLCDGPSPTEIYGCMDTLAYTYDPLANTHQPNACTYAGCLDGSASNYGTFAANGLTSYTYQGHTYGLSDIVVGCVSCCVAPTEPFDCITTPFTLPCFNGVGALGFTDTDSSGNGGNISSRKELSREYQLTQFTNSCQSMSFASAWWDDVTSAVYAWSNAQPGDLAYNANDWWFWDPQTGQSQCDWSQTDVDLLYQTLGWTSPLGTVGFQIGSGIPGNMNQKPYARPYVIWKVTLDVSGTVVYTNDLHDGTLVWQDVIDELYNNQGFDGTGAKPDVTGLDADQIQILLGSNNTWPQLWIGFVAGVCNKMLSQTCLPRVGGPYLSCIECQDDSGCNCGGCASM